MSFLGSLPVELQDRLLRGAVLRRVIGGKVFLEAGELSTGVIVVGGLLRVFLTAHDGTTITVRRVRIGCAVGISAQVGEESPVSIQAIDESALLEIDMPLLRQTGLEDGRVSTAISREIHSRLRDSYRELAVWAKGTLRQRIARQLLDAAAEHGDEQWSVRGTHQELAEAVGSSREAATRTLSELTSEKLVRVTRGAIQIDDPRALNELARSGDNHRSRAH